MESGQAARARYALLEKEWSEALRAFQLAAEAFSTAIKKIHDEAAARNLGEDDGS
jgi:hypothetical protein